MFEGVVEQWTIIKQAIRTDAIRDVGDESFGINDLDGSVVGTIVSIELAEEGEVLHGGRLQLSDLRGQNSTRCTVEETNLTMKEKQRSE
jgi:hypothetical protein